MMGKAKALVPRAGGLVRWAGSSGSRRGLLMALLSLHYSPCPSLPTECAPRLNFGDQMNSFAQRH